MTTTITTAVGAFVEVRRSSSAAGNREDKMNRPSRLLRVFLSDETGQDLIEYALIAALVAVAAIAAMKGLGNKISNEFNTIGNSL